MRNLTYACLGSLLTLVLILSCSDDSPADVDAATNCEPPLAGRIVTLENVQSGSDDIIAIAICPANATRLGGGCEIVTQTAPALTLYEAGRRDGFPGNYACTWRNPNMQQVTVKAWVTCLTPAP